MYGLIKKHSGKIVLVSGAGFMVATFWAGGGSASTMFNIVRKGAMYISGLTLMTTGIVFFRKKISESLSHNINIDKKKDDTATKPLLYPSSAIISYKKDSKERALALKEEKQSIQRCNDLFSRVSIALNTLSKRQQSLLTSAGQHNIGAHLLSLPSTPSCPFDISLIQSINTTFSGIRDSIKSTHDDKRSKEEINENSLLIDKHIQALEAAHASLLRNAHNQIASATRSFERPSL